MPVLILATPLLFQPLAKMRGNTLEDGPNAWFPVAHLDNPDEALDPWLGYLAVITVWEVNQQVKNLFISLL